MNNLQFVVCQINPHVGDISANAKKMIRCMDEYPSADVLVFPELTLTGYPPEDLLLRPSIEHRVERALEAIKRQVKNQWVILGLPRTHEGKLYNAAVVIHQAEILAEYHKMELPNYRVFDEKRYFSPGNRPAVVDIKGLKVGLTICEDLWFDRPVEQTVAAGAQLLININASPYHYKKHQQRLNVTKKCALKHSVPVIYAHMVGGQDELVFDGGSFAVNQQGQRVCQAPWFEECCSRIEVDIDASHQILLSSDVNEKEPDELTAIYSALVLGVRDYINKNGFKGVVLGLSGGIDSALTLAVATDALGPERVEAVMMPFKYTSEMSRNDAAEQAERLGVAYKSIDIESVFDACMTALDDEFQGMPADKTEENVQARCRGLLLMAISNKKGYLVLTTGNKSEMSVGYATLYGDMAGGFAVLKDVSKMRVYALAEYRNSLAEIIPRNVIERPPSAELAPDQKDEDSLPAYETLDQILELYIEEDKSARQIIDMGFAADQVHQVVRMVDINEYKRRQSAIGPRVTPRGFGRDRRYPITNGWQIGD